MFPKVFPPSFSPEDLPPPLRSRGVRPPSGAAWGSAIVTGLAAGDAHTTAVAGDVRLSSLFCFACFPNHYYCCYENNTPKPRANSIILLFLLDRGHGCLTPVDPESYYNRTYLSDCFTKSFSFYRSTNAWLVNHHSVFSNPCFTPIILPWVKQKQPLLFGDIFGGSTAGVINMSAITVSFGRRGRHVRLRPQRQRAAGPRGRERLLLPHPPGCQRSQRPLGRGQSGTPRIQPPHGTGPCIIFMHPTKINPSRITL